MNDEEMENRRWKHRRRMAYSALVSIFIVIYISLYGDVSDVRLKTVAEILTMFIMSMTAVVGAYVGFSTWGNKKGPGDK